MKFIANEYSVGLNEHTGVKINADTEDGIIDKIGPVNFDKVYWRIIDNDTSNSYELTEDYELEAV